MNFRKINKEKIISEINNRRDDLKKRGIRKIGLFGSYQKGTQKLRSDIDFLITFDKVTLDKHCEAKRYLENVFNKKIDIVIEKALRKELNYVKNEAIYVTI